MSTRGDTKDSARHWLSREPTLPRRRLLQWLLLAPLARGALAQGLQEDDTAERLRFLFDEADQLGSSRDDLLNALSRLGVLDLKGPRYGATNRDEVYASMFLDELRDGQVIWWDMDDSKPAPGWAELRSAIDYGHLTQFTLPPARFALVARDLELLVARNHFVLPESHSKVLFGLRGCMHAEGGANRDWSAQIPLSWTTPDHVSPRCVMGVWDRESGRLRSFTASTVPEVSHMFLYYYKLAGCNLLPTGMYRYRVGTHRPHSRTPQHGALCQADPSVIVLRSPTDLVFNAQDPNEAWESGMPADNIHAAHYYGRAKPPLYSSAGCQVIAGSHKGNDVSGPWAEFRSAAGFDHTTQREYRYVLLTGLEASLAAERSQPFEMRYNRIRFGSSGARVEELQRQLGLHVDGDFRTASVKAFIQHAIRNKQFQSGIVEL